MKKLLVVVMVMVFSFTCVQAREYEVTSPEGKAKVVVSVDSKSGILAKVFYLGKEMVTMGPIGIEVVGQEPFGSRSRVRRVNYREADEVIVPAVREKRRLIPDRNKEMEIVFREPYSLVFRAYDDGVAYRIKSDLPDTVLVQNELSGFRFPVDEKLYFPTDISLFTHSERSYEYLNLSDVGKENKFASTPFLIDREDGISVLVTEADLEDYPGLYVYGVSGDPLRLEVKFPPFVLGTQLFRDRDVKPVKTADYIARTRGSRYYP